MTGKKITISFRLKPSEYFWHLTRRFINRRIFLYLFLIFFLVLHLPYYPNIEDFVSDIPVANIKLIIEGAVILSMVIGSLLMVFFGFGIFLVALLLRTWLMRDNLKLQVTYIFNLSGIALVTADSKSTLKWSSLVDWQADKQGFYLKEKMNRVWFMLPKRVFGNKEMELTFRELLQEKVKRKS